MTDKQKITFQGELGAYSHLALTSFVKDVEAIATISFKQAIEMVSDGYADAAMIPVENSQWGRVSDVHFLLPKTDLCITGEFFHRVKHKLLGIHGSTLENITHVYSHPQALGQCNHKITQIGLTAIPAYDTAGAAKMIAQKQDMTQAAIASELAAEIYGLKILQSDFEDVGHNTTRFIMMQRSECIASIPAVAHNQEKMITAFWFQTRNIPAALYKVMGGFATNNVNMLRLESYVTPDKFTSSAFYAEILGHIQDKAVQRAFDELQFFATNFKILGSFIADKFRDI